MFYDNWLPHLAGTGENVRKKNKKIKNEIP